MPLQISCSCHITSEPWQECCTQYSNNHHYDKHLYQRKSPVENWVISLSLIHFNYFIKVKFLIGDCFIYLRSLVFFDVIFNFAEFIEILKTYCCKVWTGIIDSFLIKTKALALIRILIMTSKCNIFQNFRNSKSSTFVSTFSMEDIWANQSKVASIFHIAIYKFIAFDKIIDNMTN